MIWTVFPTLVVLMIGIPSLTLIYSMDQAVDRPGELGGLGLEVSLHWLARVAHSSSVQFRAVACASRCGLCSLRFCAYCLVVPGLTVKVIGRQWYW